MNSSFFRPRSARPQKALLPESECKGRHFYRKHQILWPLFFQAETLANLEKLPQTNKEYAVKHIFNTRNHARFKRELFS